MGQIVTTARPISKTILAIADVEDRFHLTPNADPQFFPEWLHDLPELTGNEQTTLERLRTRFAAHRRQGTVAEGAVDKLIISPLLDLAGFYEPEFSIRTEESVEFMLETEDELLRGRIDTLIMRNQLWVLVIEAKRTIMSSLAVPQALAYMMGNPNRDRPVYGMVSNGDEFIFLKVKQTPNPQYGASKLYSLFFPLNSQEIEQAFRVIKNIKQQIT